MKISSKPLLAIALISGAVALSGCSGFVAPPKGSPTMAQVYVAGENGQTTFNENNENNQTQDLGALDGSTLTVEHAQLPRLAGGSSSPVLSPGIVNTLAAEFPTLPNPQSLMYIFGHYAGPAQLPVPGHFVAFPLYNQTYYALPGEVMMPYNDGQFVR